MQITLVKNAYTFLVSIIDAKNTTNKIPSYFIDKDLLFFFDHH